MKRCVNIDWLEVFVVEPPPGLPPEYFKKSGYQVRVRDYGTPQYQQMFTIIGSDGRDFLEIRRTPYSKKSEGGIFPDGSCHIRLSNRSCYAPNIIDTLRKFLIAFKYEYRGLSRVDICSDFVVFDDGKDPALFVRRYIQEYYHKIGLSRVHVYGTDYDTGKLVVIDDKGKQVKKPRIEHNGHVIAAHGKDTPTKMLWNSVKWGSPSSRVNTKLYNKSLEMREVAVKFHIQDQWKAAGYDGHGDVWRLEFSVASDAKGWLSQETGEVFKLDLEEIDAPDKLNRIFNILAAKYFRFTRARNNRNGEPQRKDRCQAIQPIDTNKTEIYKHVELTKCAEPDRLDKMLAKRLREIVHDQQHAILSEREAARTLLGYFHRYKRIKSEEISDLFNAMFS